MYVQCLGMLHDKHGNGLYLQAHLKVVRGMLTTTKNIHLCVDIFLPYSSAKTSLIYLQNQFSRSMNEILLEGNGLGHCNTFRLTEEVLSVF